MKASLLALLLPAAASARFVEPGEVTVPVVAFPDEAAEGVEKFLVELAPGETRWITEDEKWELRRVCPMTPSPVHFHGYYQPVASRSMANKFFLLSFSNS